MQLSLSCSAQASQLIQSRPSRAGTKPELINLPKPIWVLQWFLGTCSARSGAQDWGGLCAQLWLAPHGAAAPLTRPNTQSSGEQAEAPTHPEGISKVWQGLLALLSQMPAVPALILPGCLQSSRTRAGLGSSAATLAQCRVWGSAVPGTPGPASLAQWALNCINQCRTERPQQSGNDFRMG